MINMTMDEIWELTDAFEIEIYAYSRRENKWPEFSDVISQVEMLVELPPNPSRLDTVEYMYNRSDTPQWETLGSIFDDVLKGMMS